MKRRVAATAVVALVWSGAIQAKLVYLQVFQHEWLSAEADRQQLERRGIPAKRGEILDRHGEVLAHSVEATTIFAVPREVTNPEATARAICAALDASGIDDRCDAGDRQAIPRRLRDTSLGEVNLKRLVSPVAASKVAALGLGGIRFSHEDRRFYPNGDFAAHVLGYVGTEHVGLGGIEHTYDDVIKGSMGAMLVRRDARQSEFGSRVEQAPTAGATLELTIDAHVQHVAERELRAGVIENGAVSGTVIVQDVWTGEILALANYPTFNPNARQLATNAALRNLAVQGIYEPGSTIKIVTAAAALEQAIVTPDEIIDVSGGRITVGSSRPVYDTRDHGLLSFEDVIVKSSNVGAIKVALQLGPHRLTEYIRRFGFGRPASPRDFPAEQAGQVWDPSQLNDEALARVAIGYQVGVTPLQMATAVSSIANGGELMQPRMLRAVIQAGVRRVIPTTVVNRTVAPAVAARLTTIMEGVVERGTGTAARLTRFSVAGKTGTTTKWDGGYTSDHVASFVGFVPSRKPVYTILVVIDSPRGPNGYYGGPVSAPVFRRIAEAVLRHAGVPPTFNAPPPLLVTRDALGAHRQPASGPVRPALIVPAIDGGADGRVPDMTGLSARDAAGALSRLRLGTRLLGDGLVVDQQPAAGTPFDPGARVTLRLSRRHPRPTPSGQQEP
jgi:cell division protein FtsI (penicillin-binding protein 3)